MKRLYGHDDASDWDDLPNRCLPHFTNRDILELWDVRRTSSQLADVGPSPQTEGECHIGVHFILVFSHCVERKENDHAKLPTNTDDRNYHWYEPGSRRRYRDGTRTPLSPLAQPLCEFYGGRREFLA